LIRRIAEFSFVSGNILMETGDYFPDPNLGGRESSSVRRRRASLPDPSSFSQTPASALPHGGVTKYRTARTAYTALKDDGAWVVTE